MTTCVCEAYSCPRGEADPTVASKDLREPPPQIDELIHAARVPVFLLDEHQVVRRGEVGSPELIRDKPEQLGCGIREINLRHQFRCAGSPEYVGVERLLMLASSKGGRSGSRWRTPLCTSPAPR